MEEKHLLWDNLEILKGALLNSRKIPIAAYLNINILRNIFNDISILLQDIPLDNFEANLDSSFPMAQFQIFGY